MAFVLDASTCLIIFVVFFIVDLERDNLFVLAVLIHQSAIVYGAELLEEEIKFVFKLCGNCITRLLR